MTPDEYNAELARRIANRGPRTLPWYWEALLILALALLANVIGWSLAVLL